MTTQRKYEIVLYGASGYTGGLIADYFATTVDVTESSIIASSAEVKEEEEEGKPKIRLALAGRNASKLENVKAEMVKLNPSCKNVDILIADTSDQKSIDDFVKETKVVLSTVGPFRQFGTPVVDSCVRHKTDYCDITGESSWVRSLIDKYHEEAKLKNLKIVPFCGYDSIPSDLGTYMLVDHAKNKLNRTLSHVTSYVGPIEGSISGGTAATMIDVMSNVRGSKLGHPFLLSPDEKSKNAPKDQKFLGYSSEVRKWTAPFFMGVVNSRVVRRSASLDPSLYGSKFRYSECVQFKNFFTAFLYSMFMLATVVVLSIPPLRTLVKKYLPKQGEGPTKKQRDSGHFSHTVVGSTVPLGVEDKPIRVEGIVRAKGDPGYEVTRKLVAESALCLALQRNKLPQHYGVITPALAMGNVLVNRLRRIGVTFEVTQPK